MAGDLDSLVSTKATGEPRTLHCVHFSQTVRAWHHAGYWIVDLRLKPHKLGHNVVMERMPVGPAGVPLAVVSARLSDLRLEAVVPAPKTRKAGDTLTPRKDTRLFPSPSRDPREGASVWAWLSTTTSLFMSYVLQHCV